MRPATDEPHAYAGLEGGGSTIGHRVVHTPRRRILYRDGRYPTFVPEATFLQDWEYVIGTCRCGWRSAPRETEAGVRMLHRDHYRREYWWRFARASDPEAQARRDADTECLYVRPTWNACASPGVRIGTRYRDPGIDWDGCADLDALGSRASGSQRFGKGYRP